MNISHPLAEMFLRPQLAAANAIVKGAIQGVPETTPQPFDEASSSDQHKHV
jgi:hypothetical protein